MTDQDLRYCKKCEKLKLRIRSGMYPDGRNYRYLDEQGKEWNGSYCGVCNVERSRENMRKKREKKA